MLTKTFSLAHLETEEIVPDDAGRGEHEAVDELDGLHGDVGEDAVERAPDDIVLTSSHVDWQRPLKTIGRFASTISLALISPVYLTPGERSTRHLVKENRHLSH